MDPLKLLEIQMETDNLKNLIPLVIERTEMLAKVRKAKYDALLQEGFSEQQAVEIISKVPLFE